MDETQPSWSFFYFIKKEVQKHLLAKNYFFSS